MSNPIVLSIQATADQARREIGTVETKASKMSRGIKNAAKVAGAGLLLVGAGALKAAQAAADDDAAASRLAQTLRTAAKATDTQVASTEKWITAQGKALGVSDDELRPAIGKLAVATGSVTRAQKLAAIAMDVSAGSGKSLDSVTSALAKAQTGSLGGFTKLGIATKDQSGKTKTLKQLTGELADKYKGAAGKAAETTAGKQRKLSVQLGELTEQIGAKLLPALSQMATIGLKAVEWASTHETTFKVLGGILLGVAAAILVVAAVTKVYTAGAAIYNAVTKAMTFATIAWKNAQFALNIVMNLNPISLVVIAIVALIAIFVIAYKKSDKFKAVVDKAFSFIKKAIPAAVGFVVNFIKSHWPLILAIMAGPLGLLVLAVVKNWDKIKSSVKNAVSFVVDKIKAFRDKVVGLKDAVLGAFDGAKDWLINAGIDIIQGLLDGIESMIGAVKDKLKSLTDLIPDLKGPKSRDKRLLTDNGRLIMQSLIDGFDQSMPAVRRALTGVTKEIGGFDADLHGAVSIRSQLASASAEQPVRIDVVLTAEQFSILEQGRRATVAIAAYKSNGGRAA